MAVSALSAEIVPAGAGARSNADSQDKAVFPTPEQSIARLKRAAALVAADAEELLADSQACAEPALKAAAGLNVHNSDGPLPTNAAKSAQTKMSVSPGTEALLSQAAPSLFLSRYPAAIKSNGWRTAALVAIGLCALLAGVLGGVQMEPHLSASKSIVDIGADENEALQERVRTLMGEIDALRATRHSSASDGAIGNASGPVDPASLDIQGMAKMLRAQALRIERLERLLADPLVTNHSSPAQESGLEDYKHAGPRFDEPSANAPARQGLNRIDPAIPENSFILRGVHAGRATIQTRRGLIDIGPGDKIEGIGRISSIEKIDGRWVVLTNNGMIDARE